ncbi:protein FAM210A-like [Teleopsis dalmanni]|uniref:protein FAM210A-like n=1 Tax=Teleopsis dalmanni TaxID=139649 RepID=UPI000D329CD4|nr:protein FAM210A-like [Teleopsis dalmanni]
MSTLKAIFNKQGLWCAQQRYALSKLTRTTCIATCTFNNSSANSSNSTRKYSNFAPHLNNEFSKYDGINKTLLTTIFWQSQTTSRQYGKKSPQFTSKEDAKAIEDDLFGETSKLGLFARFKLMYKKYWYVLIPVHIVTSIGWFGSFYYLSKSGVDVPSMLQYIHLSESIINKVQDSEMGHIAIAYLCYKVVTPLRYALTLGGTTVSIKYLVQAGHIKPIPSKKDIIKIYAQKKADRAAAKAEKEDKFVEKK